MKSLTRIAAVALLLFSFNHALAAEVENFEAKTTRDLVKLCGAAEGHDLHGAAMGYCLGFIDAATDYHAVITSGELLQPIACPGPAVTRRDLLDAFLAWAGKNDALLDTESPIHGLMRAATEKWPCE